MDRFIQSVLQEPRLCVLMGTKKQGERWRFPRLVTAWWLRVMVQCSALSWFRYY